MSWKTKYYKTREEAMLNRKKGEVIYYDAEVGAYYLVRIKRKEFWSV